MSNTPFTLRPGEIRRLHHTAVPYHSRHQNNPRQKPWAFRKIRKFWSDLGMRCEAIFAGESPDRGGQGWRLYVGSVRDPVQIVYRPSPSTSANLLPAIRRQYTHICLDVGPDTLRKLRQHPAFERKSKWGPRHGLSSVLIAGPLGEETEFTCSSPVHTDD